MTPDRIDLEFDAALSAFRRLQAEAPPLPEPLPGETDEWLDSLPDILTSPGGLSAPKTFSLSTMTYAQAERCITAASDVVEAVRTKAKETGNFQLHVLCRDAIVGLLAEYMALINAGMDKTNHIYRPITDEFTRSAGALKEVHARAKQMADALNLAADLVKAFGKLVAVV